MRLPTTLLSLTLLATASVGARWDDPGAGIPVLTSLDLGGLATGRSATALQDARGRLYLAHDHVFEFDGLRWKRIAIGQGDSTSGLDLDPDGRIWCAGGNELGYLDEDATGQRTFHSLRGLLPADMTDFRAWRVYCAGDRVVFACTDRLLIWDGTRFDVRILPAERRLFTFTFEGVIHVSQPGSALWRWERGKLVPVDLGGIEKTAVQAAWRDRDGNAVYLAQNCLVRVSEGRARPFAEDTLAEIRPHTIANALTLPDGNVAVVTFSAGVYVIQPDGTILRHLDRRDGLPSLLGQDMILDRNGGCWLAAESFAVRLDPRFAQSLFTAGNGMPGDVLRVLNSHTHGLLSLTTEGVHLIAPGDWHGAAVRRLDFLKGAYTSLEQLPDGTTVAGGIRQLVRLDDDHAVPLVAMRFTINAIVPIDAPKPFVALATSEDVSLVDLGADPVTLNRIPGFPADAARIAIDGHRNLWTTTRRNGVNFARLQGESTKPARHLSPGVELPMPFDDPQLFVLGGDAFAFAPGAVIALPAESSAAPRIVLPGVDVLAAERSGTDSVWAVARRPHLPPRLVRIHRDAAGMLSLRSTDQVLPDLSYLNNLCRTEEHLIWVCGSRGLLRIDTRDVRDEQPPEAPLLQSVTWLTPQEEVRLPLSGASHVAYHRTGAVQVQWRDGRDSLSPNQPIETRVIGSDDTWRHTGGTLDLAGLDEGTYTLEARVVGFLGNPGPVVRYTFTITPPWFRTPLAYLAYVLLFGGSLYSAAQWRTRRIRRQNAQLEQLVNRRTEELAQAVSARSAFLANMGHEIRNPLNGVVGLVDTLRSRALAEEEKGIVARIGTCADQLISVIDDVLEYARIDAGRIALRNRAFTVGEPVEGAIDILRAAKPEAVIELQGGGEDLDSRIIGDPDRIRHILVNYISNALKFGGGTSVQVGVRRDGPLLVLSVTDHGPGIAPEEQARLFVRFSRGSAAYRHGIPGTGLGLAACKAYAGAMGGDVSVESEPGQGATFFLRLPFRPATEGADASAGAARPDLMVGKRALVVDDQDFNRFVLTDLLGRMGATTEQASNIEEARAAFRAHVPDIVFVDFDLAGATGADLATWIRQEAPAGRDVPVVATTAFEVDEVRRRCDEAGMDGFLAKPVTAHRLSEVVARIESIRSGGPAPAAPTAEEPAMPSSFLDILAGGDPAKRREIERSTWREVLTEALAAHRALRRDDAALTARHAHRLVSAALILSERELVAAARELNGLAKAGDLPAARRCAAQLRQYIRRARGVATAPAPGGAPRRGA